VAEVVEAKRRSAASVEAGTLDRVREGGAGDVSLPERCAQPGCEHVVVFGREAGAASFTGEDGGELRGERDVADGGARLRCHAAGGGSQVRPRELGADADEAGFKVNLGPGEGQQFGEAHAGIESGRQQRSVTREAGTEKVCDLCLAEDALRAGSGPWSLGLLQSSQGVVENVPPAGARSGGSRRVGRARSRPSSAPGPFRSASRRGWPYRLG
jgi:hypothetical protein